MSEEKKPTAREWALSELVQAREAQERIAALESQIAEVSLGGRRDQAAALFAEVELPAAAVELYLAELTEDQGIDEGTVRDFGVRMYGLEPSGEEEGESAEWEPIAGLGTVDEEDTPLTQAEGDRLLREDPAKWMQLVNKGRIGRAKIGPDKPSDWSVA